MSEFYIGVDDMVEDGSRCNWCGASISGTAKNCPKCGKPVTTKLVKREISGIKKQKSYSGVFQQQGRMLTDADWDESVRITKTREEIAIVQCSSCGANNESKETRCENCGANL
jgi:predicted amidophosphoribosyltransferase